MKKYTFGADPGKAGAIALLDIDTDELKFFLYPRNKKSTALDAWGIHNIFKKHQPSET